MLDDCKGDRFEELLAKFAIVVLRKCFSGREDLPLVTRLLLDQPTGHGLDLSALSLAYRSSLQDQIQRRHKIQSHYEVQHDLLERCGFQVQQRHRDVLGRLSEPRAGSELDIQYLKSVWSGDLRWLEILLSDLPATPKPDSVADFLNGSGEELFKTSQSGTSEALVNDLDQKIHIHASWLKRWKLFQTSMEDTDHADAYSTNTIASPTQNPYSFDKHQDLTLSLNASTSGDGIKMNEEHADLLQRMKNDLEGAEPDLRRGMGDGNNVQAEARVWNEANNGIYGQGSVGEDCSKSEASNTAPTASHDQRSDMLARPTPEPQNPLQSETVTQKQDWGTDVADRHAASVCTPSHTGKGTSDRRQKMPYDSSARELPTTDGGNSLEHRTRVSLANILISHDEPKQVSRPRTGEVELQQNNPAWSSSPPIADSKPSLAERTRQSISLLDRLSEVKTQTQKSRTSRVSQLFPVNQFETPRRSLTPRRALTPLSGDSTPREQLFSDEADEASVFKSRVRIALSPLISPERAMIDDSILLDTQQMDLNHS